MKRSFKLFLVLIFYLPTFLFANNEFVVRYFERFDSLEANFTQTIKSKKQNEVSSGKLHLQKRSVGQIKPKFAFDYTSPYRQQLVSDGNRLWHYDVDLMQVVIKPMQEINSNPLLVILLGNKTLDNYFDIQSRGNERYILTPKKSQGSVDFKAIELQFRGGVIDSFSALDVTGQEIIIQLSNIKQNPIFDDAYFRFTPPKGVDVIDETR